MVDLFTNVEMLSAGEEKDLLGRAYEYCVMVKRLLKKYKYPPEGQEEALQMVMNQCENWAENENYDDLVAPHR